ncbi:MAG: hypothetical protein A3E78_08300 [Alphaproteobacteria bacterium RIFCSPHIGHO2_12_FULL_63_12]|nr:MAG: hypothetical protein A3E78_08300 [Alphaproteobacteria bacterium RIFCSPHIGHO2_12_FULL_63_12]
MNNPESVKRSPGAAQDVVRFWFDVAGRKKWFRGGPAFDAEIRARFSGHYQAASLGLLDCWRATPTGALALLILLDQFPRNMFRRDARAFASDPFARLIAAEAIRRRFDRVGKPERRPFFYLPFMHSESLDDQKRCVALFKATMPGSANLPFAIEHYEIIRRFGRFPHRNAPLGRASTREEHAFLKNGGFRG